MNENLDPDLTDFCQPKPKKGKGGGGNRFATPLAEADIVEYSKGT